MNLLCVTLGVNLIAALAKERGCNCTALGVDTVLTLSFALAEENHPWNCFLHKCLALDKPVSTASICIHRYLQTYSGTVFLSQATLRWCEPTGERPYS